jgi:hypothetical protein
MREWYEVVEYRSPNNSLKPTTLSSIFLKFVSLLVLISSRTVSLRQPCGGLARSRRVRLPPSHCREAGEKYKGRTTRVVRPLFST